MPALGCLDNRRIRCSVHARIRRAMAFNKNVICTQGKPCFDIITQTVAFFRGLTLTPSNLSFIQASIMISRVLLSWLLLASGILAQTCSSSSPCAEGCCSSYGSCVFGPDCKSANPSTAPTNLPSLRRQMRFQLRQKVGVQSRIRCQMVYERQVPIERVLF
jgi:hypothetical protein